MFFLVIVHVHLENLNFLF